MRTIYILAIMFAVLFAINLATLFGVCYTGQSKRVIFKVNLATALTAATSGLCFVVVIALNCGLA